jgi:hypothetical protein
LNACALWLDNVPVVAAIRTRIAKRLYIGFSTGSMRHNKSLRS